MDLDQTLTNDRRKSVDVQDVKFFRLGQFDLWPFDDIKCITENLVCPSNTTKRTETKTYT